MEETPQVTSIKSEEAETESIPHEEANNNAETQSKIVKQEQTDYDVLGGNDEELARRKLIEEENDDYDYEDRDSFKANDVESDRKGGKQLNHPHDNHQQQHQYQLQPQPQPQPQLQPQLQQAQNQHHQSSLNNHSTEEPEQLRKLFIGGLDYRTTEATLRRHFSNFGEVVDCEVKLEPQTKRSRGFGFVTYAHSSMVDRAQEARPHEVDGRLVEPKRAHSREDAGKPESQATVKRAYLRGLGDDLEESDLREYFKEFGNIVSITILVHKDTGKKRGFAFVEYDDYDPVDKIVLIKFHTIKDKRIEAKKALSKSEMDARKRCDPRISMVGPMMGLPTGPPMDGPGGRSRQIRNGVGGGGRIGDGCLWDSNYPAAYSNQADYGYAAHYHAPSSHYGAANQWMMHGGSSGSYQGANYVNQPATDWASPPGGGGPIRLRDQHQRCWGPYGAGYRGRGYN